MKEWTFRRAGAFAAAAVIALAGCGVEGDGPAERNQAGAGHRPAEAQPPRLIAPISGSMSLTRRPLLRWLAEKGHENKRGESVEICADRACTRPISTLTGHQEAQPAADLPPGVVFWRVRAAQASGAVSATWELRIPAESFGRSGVWGALPDYNGDGFADVVIGAVPPGGIGVFFGGPAGLGSTPNQVLGEGQARFGQDVTPAGDVNGDGFMDLAISGTPSADEVTVYYGGPKGLTPGTTLIGGGSGFGFPSPIEVRLVAGRAMSTAGDENGDGYADLLIGQLVRGHLFRGGPSGIDPNEVPDLVMPDGIVVAGGADFNGDGIPDAVGGNLFRGTGAGFVQFNNDFFAAGEFVGDYNGDSFADYARPSLFGAPPMFGGGEILAGSPSGLLPIAQIAALEPFGAAGDLNGDGLDDVLALVRDFVEVPEWHQIFFFNAPPGAQGPTPAPVPGHLHGDATQIPLMRGVGDVDGDGFDDLVAGTADTGQVYLLRGSRDGVHAAQLFASSYPGLGFSIAGL